MKRSTHLRLTLMAAAIPVALAGCDQGPPTGEVLSSLDDCSRVTDVSPQECRASYESALAQHQAVAPRFESHGDCNDQFGTCTSVTNERGETNWIPPMSGFLLGYALSSALNSNSGYGSGASAGGYRVINGSSPLYRDYRSGEYVKPNGDVAARGAGKVTGSNGNPSVPSRAITVSRSGFGSSSAARSSFGSGGRGFGG